MERLQNIMIGTDESVQLIDFEYMAWNRKKPGLLYAYYLGYLFQKWLHQHLDEERYKSWFEENFQRRKTVFDESESEIRHWFDTARTKELSRAERHGIFVC